jgi:hypothetical protein
MRKQPGRRSASFASMHDRESKHTAGKYMLLRVFDKNGRLLRSARNDVCDAKLWRTTTRKPMLLFLLFGWLLLRIETRALFSLLFHEPPRRPCDLCPDVPPSGLRKISNLFQPCAKQVAHFFELADGVFVLSDGEQAGIA